MISCFNVARYFLAQVDEDAGDSLTNLKLQKLVYYAQGFHLALTTNLFSRSVLRLGGTGLSSPIYITP